MFVSGMLLCKMIWEITIASTGMIRIRHRMSGCITIVHTPELPANPTGRPVLMNSLADLYRV